VYHEHFHYLSFQIVVELFEKCGLRVFDVEELGTHGGSLRVWATRAEFHAPPHPFRSVADVLTREDRAGVRSWHYYASFQSSAEAARRSLLRFLLDAREANQSVAGYGAAAKGNTLLNFTGVSTDLVPFVADKSVHKQGKFTPGSRIPIVSPARLVEMRPDVVLILPWNIRSEIESDLRTLGLADVSCVCAVPRLSVTAL
jgi:hypothetical protein